MRPPAPPILNLDSPAQKFGDGAYNGQVIFRPTTSTATPRPPTTTITPPTLTATPTPRPPTSTTAPLTLTATPTPIYPGGVPAYDIVMRGIWDGAGGTIAQLAGFETDLSRKEYGCKDEPEWLLRGDNEEAENGLPPTITGIDVYGDTSCRYDKSRDYEPAPDDGSATVGYISCDKWPKLICYKNMTTIGSCDQWITMQQRLSCAWLYYHGQG